MYNAAINQAYGMTQLETIQSMIGDSMPADWIPFADMGTWTYRDDVKLRLQRHEQLNDNLQTQWTQHLQGNSQNFSYLVYYGDSPVEYHTIASVDNFRAHIPMPRQPSGPNQPYTISQYQATLGRIITGDEDMFQSYLNNTGVQIR
jgi:hypothetical protein